MEDVTHVLKAEIAQLLQCSLLSCDVSRILLRPHALRLGALLIWVMGFRGGVQVSFA